MNWFSDVFSEYEQRGEAMFAFSREQVEEKGVTWADFQSDQWCALGAGLHVKRAVRDQFIEQVEAAHQADQAAQPEVRVRYIGTDHWDRPLYKTDDGRHLADVGLNPPGEAVELHTLTSEGEPIAALPARLVFVTATQATGNEQ
jgi:hypothetical protein